MGLACVPTVEMWKLGRRLDGSIFTIVAQWLVLKEGADVGNQEGSVAGSDLWCEEYSDMMRGRVGTQ